MEILSSRHRKSTIIEKGSFRNWTRGGSRGHRQSHQSIGARPVPHLQSPFLTAHMMVALMEDEPCELIDWGLT